MNVNLAVNIVYGAVFLIVLTSLFPKCIATDTIIVVSSGVENSVIIDSAIISLAQPDSVFGAIKGSVIQTGNQNRVEINSGIDSISDNKKSIIKIKQQGNNNSIKINSQ